MEAHSVEYLPKLHHLALHHHHSEEQRDFVTSEPLLQFLGTVVDPGSNSI